MSIRPDQWAPFEARLLPNRRVPDPPDSGRYHRGHGHPGASGGAASTTAGADPPAPGPQADDDARPHRTTEVQVHQHLLAANDRHAAGIRSLLREHGVFAVNLMSSPGAGKTALIEATLARLGTDMRVAVIEGDIETTADADRIAPFGIPVIQINTGPFGGDCHLAAPLVAGAIEQLDLHGLDLLVVENVGNLVCPAEFDIGEHRKIVLLSVTEGEDKPLKYPLMFLEASLAVVTKIDLLPHLEIDLDVIRANMRAVNPALEVLTLSARSGEGIDSWLEWLRRAVAGVSAETASPG
ncbi:MAG: hydrogenase nickel incorporation protein HypB [Thermoleophilia bacterium]|nr:hydrogenase nickel incorporation protein HypB [Thermoleophilia bacterium]